MGGYIGLDYSVLYRKLDRMNLEPARYDELEFEICVIEGAALEELNRRDESADP